MSYGFGLNDWQIEEAINNAGKKSSDRSPKRPAKGEQQHTAEHRPVQNTHEGSISTRLQPALETSGTQKRSTGEYMRTDVSKRVLTSTAQSSTSNNPQVVYWVERRGKRATASAAIPRLLWIPPADGLGTEHATGTSQQPSSAKHRSKENEDLHESQWKNLHWHMQRNKISRETGYSLFSTSESGKIVKPKAAMVFDSKEAMLLRLLNMNPSKILRCSIEGCTFCIPAASITSEGTMPLSISSTLVQEEEVKTAATELLILVRDQKSLQKLLNTVSHHQLWDSIDFEARMRRSLERLAKNLEEEAQTRMQNLTVRLISKQACIIARELRNDYILEESSNQGLTFDQIKSLNSEEDRRFQLSKWLKTFDHHSRHDHKKQEEDASSDGESEMAPEEELPSLAAAKEFILRSEAFEDFLMSIQAWGAELILAVAEQFQSVYNDIAIQWKDEIGSEIPWTLTIFAVSSIRVSSEVSSIPLIDRIKEAIESSTRSVWDWWPLSPPQRALAGGCVRLEWCVPRWRRPYADISPGLASELIELYTHIKSSGHRSQLSEDNIQYRLSGGSPTILAPQDTSQDIAPVLGQSNSIAREPASKHSRTKTKSELNEASDQTVPDLSKRRDPRGNEEMQLEIPTEFYILFGVPSGRSISHKIIGTPRCEKSKAICDEAFFDMVHEKYRQRCSFFHYWLNPRQFDHCHAWKFQKTNSSIFKACKEFPAQLPYVVDPQPPKTPYQSSIAEDIWYFEFYKRRWYWTLYKAVKTRIMEHRLKCKVQSHTHKARLLNFVPKRITEFDLENDDSEDFVWGIRVHYNISFAIIFMWLISFIFIAVTFFVWFEVQYPGHTTVALLPWVMGMSTFVFFWTPLSAFFNND